MLKASEIRNESEGELLLKLSELRKEIFYLRSLRVDSKSQKTHLIKEKRKAIARILTCKNEKRRAREEEVK